MQMMQANPRKTDSIRRLGRVDIDALRDAVAAIPESIWNAENEGKPNTYGALGETRHIIFRFVSDIDDWRQSSDSPLWAEWRPLIQPVIDAATEPFGYTNPGYPRIMLARMAPGGTIYPHRDANPSAKWPHKIHVPIQTNPDVTFIVDGQQYHFEEGEAVEVNNMGMHAVANRGSTDRIHLIFECYDRDQPEPDWLESLLAANAR